LIGVQGSPAIGVGITKSLCTVGGRPPSTSRVVECYSVEELGSQLLDRGDIFSCREVQCEVLAFCVPGRKRTSGATCRVAGF
jgi:hypothetical protein